jgi:hypothetical protein
MVGMKVNRLVLTIEATHQSLQQRLEAATGAHRGAGHPREGYRRVDTFMAATSRHLAAAEEVLPRVVERRVPGSEERVKEYLHQTRVLEQAVARLKARAYGEVHAAYLSWAQVWEGVRRELTRHNELERSLVHDLVAELDEREEDALAERIYRAEVAAPTRAHPYIPHHGRMGHLARRVAALVDRFWDTADGRVVPAPVRPPSKEHSHDSLVAQYLVAEPHFDGHAPMVAHRRRRR